MRTSILLALLCTNVFAQLPPTKEIPADTVVAKVDGKDVTAGEIRSAMAIMPKEFVELYNRNPQYAIQQLFMLRYLAEEAEKEKLGDESPLKEQLAFIRANTMASAMVSHEHNYFPVSEQMVKEYYDRNQSRYQQSKIKVIYIAFKPSIPPAGSPIEEISRATAERATSKAQRTEEEARKLAEDLVKQIRGGADFGKLVTEYSEDPTSKAAGGDFGTVSITSAYSNDIKKAVLALNPGEVTDPIREHNAFYIIRVEDKKIQPMNDVAEPIRQELRQAHLNDWLKALGKRFEPTIEDQQFFTKPVQPGGAVAPPAAPKPAPAPAAK
jgi:parvulin-like peptidyl-prolyl isomerase